MHYCEYCAHQFDDINTLAFHKRLIHWYEMENTILPKFSGETGLKTTTHP
jgi:hypothetical protein